MGRREDTELDRELAVLPPEMRWREWMRRIEAVLFASANPVARDHLARVVGRGASVDLLIEDLAVDLEGRPYEVSQVGAGWMLRTKPAFAPSIRAAADAAGGIGIAGEKLFEEADGIAVGFAVIVVHDDVEAVGAGRAERRRNRVARRCAVGRGQ